MGIQAVSQSFFNDSRTTEYHQRQLVDGSDPFYIKNPFATFARSAPEGRERTVGRKDLNPRFAYGDSGGSQSFFNDSRTTEYHQRQLVDGSDPFYIKNPFATSRGARRRGERGLLVERI